jgi:uncharacterized protein (TIGR00251 family)
VSWFRWDGDDLVLQLRVLPRAASDGFAGVLGDTMKLRITAPPVDGKANAHLATFLGGLFGVARRAVVIEQGVTGRSKRVRVQRPQRLPPEIPSRAGK